MANYKSKQSRKFESQNNGKKYSKEEYSAIKDKERNEAYALADSAISKLIDSPENLKAYLDTQSRFDRYSVTNALLIMEQYPNAIQLKDYNEWSEAGSQVKRGAKSISILEPVEYTRKDGSTGITYNVKKVFDVSQTNARYHQPTVINRDPTKLVKALLETTNVDYQIAQTTPDDRAAYFDNNANILYVKEGVGDGTKLFQAIAQELSLAEIYFNSDTFVRSEALFSAQCASYMICHKYGVDTKGIDINKTPLHWKAMENKNIRSELTMARDSLNEISTKLYFELNKDKSPREQER
jgi:ribosomal protein L14